MIKPGSKDKNVFVLIGGRELAELKRITWLMADSFGLDTRIDNYHGKRAIGLHSWDFECLLAAIDHALKGYKDFSDTTSSGYKALIQLYGRLLDEYHNAFGKET
jgi:DnaJ-domain-containing protein 1